MGRALTFLMEWLWRLLYLNAIWILFSLPVITVIPATASMFSVMDKWVREDHHKPDFKVYFREFKRLFLKSYSLGLSIVLIGGLLFLDLLILRNAVSDIFVTIRYGLLLFSLLFLIAVSYSFPVFLRYQFPWYKTLFFSFMLGVRNPVITFLMSCGFLLVLLLVMFATGVGILLFASLIALISTISAHFIINGLPEIAVD
ncbi:YesL family protein [Neobacillus sp. NPDC093182]|uniref:YesL family protein n=1 Tax=Neobacillus sp. NPDC093182 TaxID=3364297 RepID=UPI0037F4B37D